jgi:hypothetical protein
LVSGLLTSTIFRRARFSIGLGASGGFGVGGFGSSGSGSFFFGSCFFSGTGFSRATSGRGRFVDRAGDKGGVGAGVSFGGGKSTSTISVLFSVAAAGGLALNRPTIRSRIGRWRISAQAKA